MALSSARLIDQRMQALVRLRRLIGGGGELSDARLDDRLDVRVQVPAQAVQRRAPFGQVAGRGFDLLHLTHRSFPFD
ncbi:MAG: hypothetical protein IPK65_12820 [Gammaproteobacteria bacterium]|nr:hypothetical protein [Gammaproteobacteria bacterium]